MSRKKTKKIRPRDNPRAKSMFYIALGLLVWMQAVQLAIIISAPFRGESLDPFATGVFLTIIISFLGGALAIWYTRPPFHNLVYVGALINAVISFFLFLSGDGTQLIQALLSTLVLYLGYRYPIEFVHDQATFTSR